MMVSNRLSSHEVYYCVLTHNGSSDDATGHRIFDFHRTTACRGQEGARYRHFGFTRATMAREKECSQDGQAGGDDLWFFSLQHTSLHSTLGQFVFPISKANRFGAARCWKPASLADSRGLSCLIVLVQLLSWSAEFRSLACSRTAKREKSEGLRKRGADVGCGFFRPSTEDKDNGS